MQMDHQDLANIIEKRLDRLETKLDKHLEQTAEHHADLVWVRGYIRTSIMALITLAGGVLTTIFKLFVRT